MEWADSGCSMCVGMNGDLVGPGERCASTTNRNFRGRQGKDARTHLMSARHGGGGRRHRAADRSSRAERGLGDMDKFTTLDALACPLASKMSIPISSSRPGS